MITNATIKTPIGDGVCQGRFAPGNEATSLEEPRLVVRLPVTDATRSALRRSNCLTPHAVGSGLWVFRLSETGGGRVNNLALAGLVIAVIIVLGRCGWPW